MLFVLFACDIIVILCNCSLNVWVPGFGSETHSQRGFVASSYLLWGFNHSQPSMGRPEQKRIIIDIFYPPLVHTNKQTFLFLIPVSLNKFTNTSLCILKWVPPMFYQGDGNRIFSGHLLVPSWWISMFMFLATREKQCVLLSWLQTVGGGSPGAPPLSLICLKPKIRPHLWGTWSRTFNLYETGKVEIWNQSHGTRLRPRK